jgi:hypothetical protein
MSSKEPGILIHSARDVCNVCMAAFRGACDATDEPKEEVCPCIHMYTAVGDAAATYGEAMLR